MSNKLLEENYSDKEIVWVKLGRGLWWPGEVCCEERLPDGLMSSLKTKPVSIVRFFNEDQFEFVKSWSNICKYNNPKKHDFIKKGLDSYRANHKHVKKFPGDVELAELLTNGDPHIISREEFQPHSRKSVWADIFKNKKQLKTPTINKKIKATNTASSLKRSQSFRKSIDHEIRILTQPSTSQTNSYSSNTPGSSDQIYRCHLCDFSSKRVNVVMLHSKSHGSMGIYNARQNFVPQTNVTPVSSFKRFLANDSSNEKEIKKNSSDSSDDEALCITRKNIILPKKRGRPFRKESLLPTELQTTIKSRVRGKRKFVDPEPEFKNDTINVEIIKQKDILIKIENDDVENDVETKSASKKSKTEHKVEFKKKLLEDWVEDDSDGDTKSPIKSHIGDVSQAENSLNSTYDDLPSSKDQKENKSNHVSNESKDNFTNCNTITKYRNIPKKDRKREFIFDVITSPTHSTELNKSIILTDEISNVEIDTSEHANEINNLENKPVTKDFLAELGISSNENECKSINKMCVETSDQFDIIQGDEGVQIHVTVSSGEEMKTKDNILVNVISIKDTTNQELDSFDIIKTQVPKPSEITCFDFQDDDEIEFTRSPPRRQRHRKSVNVSLDNHNKLCSDIDRSNERDNDIQKQTDIILQITGPPQVPELPILQSTEHLIISDEKKELSLPPKERGKRIFKSRNRNKITLGNQTQLIKKHFVEYDVEKDDGCNSPSKPTDSDLQIAETPINITSRTSHIIGSNLDENSIVTTVTSDNIDNLPVHVSRKKHLQAAFRAEEEKNHNNGTQSIQFQDNTSSLPSKESKESSQLISVLAQPPKQKVVLKLNEDEITNNPNKFEPRTPKKRKPATDDDIKSKQLNDTIDENVFDINNMEIVISNEVIQNEPIENLQSSIEPIVIQSMLSTVEIDSRDEIKQNESISRNIKEKTVGQTASPKLESMNKLSVGSDAIVVKKPKLITRRSDDNNSTLSTNSSIYKKSQIIQATAGGQIVITSKGQLLTTNSQTQLTSISQTCETTTSCVKSISSTKSKETTPKIQVQSQKIIYPSSKMKSNKTKSMDKNYTESPNKVKMSLQRLTEMTKLGYIKEKGTERIITATGLKRIKQHLLTGSKDRIAPLTKNNPTDTNSTITTSPISQLAPQLPTASKITETTMLGDTTESLPQIISTTSALTSTANSISEITENYYACAAESFGGPPNSFYLCRAGENNTFIPIDNRALYLDANNRLVEDVPDTINTFDTISNQNASTSAVLNSEQIGALELNSSTSDNIEIQDVSQSFIINTLDGQQIILDQQSLLSLAAGEMPHLITADGQQIILQGSPQDIITAIAVNQQEIALMTDDQHIIIPQCEGQSTLGNNDIISVALEGSDVHQRHHSPEPLIGEVIIQNPPHSEIVGNQNNLPTATATVLSNPIMSTLEVPTKTTLESNNLTLESGLNIDDSLAVIGVNTTHSNVPSSLELPITVTNPAIAAKTTPLSLNTIYTPTVSSIGAIGQISHISPSLGYDIFDTSSSSSSSKGTGLCPEKNGNILSSNITISQLNSHDENLNGNDNNIDEEIENGNIIPQSPEIEINISSVNDASESPLPCVNYDDNSDNSDEIPIQPNLIIFNTEKNNIDNNGHEMIDQYDNTRKSHNDDEKQSSQSSNINDKDDRRL